MIDPAYDALLVVSFGGPERKEDVIPFLEKVLRGRNVPRERMLEVAEHYYHFGGASPINEQNRALIAALEAKLASAGPPLPVYWGNRNWHPLLSDTLRQMAHEGVRRALAFVTSAFSSYSGCRQYRENIEAARQIVGPSAPSVDKLRVFFNHPGFISAVVDRTRAAWQTIDVAGRDTAQLVFTAHSIPSAMAERCQYVAQLNEACRLVAEELGSAHWKLVYQSRSGPSTQPWLEPDILDHLRALAADGTRHVVLCPIGFLSDHMEVLYDLDTETRQLGAELNLNLVRAATVGCHPVFIDAIHELIRERLDVAAPRRSLGNLGPSHDVCPADCCPYIGRSQGSARN